MKQQGVTVFMTVLLLSCALQVYSSGVVVKEKLCDANLLEQCHYDQTCQVLTRTLNKTTQHLNGICRCLEDYVLDGNGNCIRSADIDPDQLPLKGNASSASSVAAGILIPLTLIAAVGALIYFGRRYHWWQKLRQAPVRQYDTVLIGAQIDSDDDPPIS